MYRFKDIQTVPDAKAFVDIVLSRTQRKTPTVVHPGYNIHRIRDFYMRKVKYAQSTFNEKLTKVLEEFPRIDDVHPFYADLCNVLYDRDHYKIALGQINAVRTIVDNIAKDYVRMMKFADSLYKCKMLKRAALGRMCTSLKRMHGSLKYLEEVRQHLARLPQINPLARSLIVTGYPNVGKSSFMNLVTQANVDVQPYAFTTKSLYVGHMDFNFCRWQVLDTPGILDHPLEDRNTIEMTAITALAHLQATVLYFVDISEMCGYTIEAQVKLFHSIKALFSNKPLLVVLNKTDLRTIQEISPADLKLLQTMKVDDKVKFYPMSCATKDGVDSVRTSACELLLERRLEQKNASVQKRDAIKSRIYVTKVEANPNRPACVPPGVASNARSAEMGEEEEEKVTEKTLQERFGGAGVYSVDMRKNHELKREEWKYDQIPEIMDGKNVWDFVDPEIDARLAELEAEEDLLMKAQGLTDDDAVLTRWEGTKAALKDVHSVRRQKMLESKLRRANKSAGAAAILKKKVKTVERTARALERTGRDVDEEAIRGRATSVRRREVDMEEVQRRKSAPRTKTPSRLDLSLKREEDREKSVRDKRMKERVRNKFGKKGDADNAIPVKMPKHLYSGKRSFKADRR